MCLIKRFRFVNRFITLLCALRHQLKERRASSSTTFGRRTRDSSQFFMASNRQRLLAVSLEPSERIVFALQMRDRELMELPATNLTIRNTTDTAYLFKVKCSSNELFKIRPPVGLLKPNSTAIVKLTLLKTDDVPGNDKHFFSVYDRPTDDETTKPRDQWQDKEPRGHRQLYVRFE